MTVHHPAFLRLYDNNGTTLALQNYYMNGNVAINGDIYQFLDFSIGDVTSSISADTSNMQITLPALTTVVLQIELALAQGLLGRLVVYRFEADAAPNSPPAGQTVLIDVIGEAANANSRFDSSITLELGSALAPIGSQVPPRRFTSELVGVPARL